MRKTVVLTALSVAILCLLNSCEDDSLSPAWSRPNILFISIDTLRADYLGAYGGEHAPTPVLDGLANDGVLFERAVAHAPMTLPSHASMFTSLIPPSHGVRDNGTFVLEPRHETLAERLESSGYRTGAFLGAFVLDAQFGLAQGFEVYDDDVEGTAENDRRADAVLGAARRWLDDLGPDEPWFAFVHLFDPHAPYEAPGAFGASHRDEPYAGEVAYVDDALGRFLEGLRARGKLDNTLIVVTADHGEGLGEHGERTHGMFAYDSTLHVPLIFHWPQALPTEMRVATRVRHIDIAPTVAELAGVDPPKSFRGQSLVDLMQGRVEPDRASYFETLTYTFNYGLAPLRGLYEESHKFVALPIPELYDLDNDPRERQNLAPERAATVARLSTHLSELVRDELIAERDAVPSPSPLDDDGLERLESLGYISAANRLPELDEYGVADDPKRWAHLAEMLDEAVAHHRARRPADAIRLLQAIIAEKDDVAIAHTRLARILHEEGRANEAIAVLEEALAIGVTNPNVITALGALLREEGDEAKWSRVLEDAVRRNPNDAQAHEALASSLMRQGLPEAALPHLRRFVELDPTQFETLVQIGLASVDLGRIDDARRYFRQFATTAPDEIYRDDKKYVRELLSELDAMTTSP